MESGNLSDVSNKQILSVLSVLQKTTNDYLYFWDITTDTCTFAQSSVKKFHETETKWHEYSKNFCNNVHQEDVKSLKKAIGACLLGKTESYKIQYRRIMNKDDYIWLEASGQVITSSDKHRILLGRIAEIGNKNGADNKTGLKNKETFRKEIDFILQNNSDSINFILRIDIDHFKKINERDGLETGDRIIKQLSKTLVANIGNFAQVYTLDADDFIIVDTDPSKESNPVKLYNILKAEIVSLIRKDKNLIFYTISAGAMIDCFDERNANNILEMTEFALSEAKHNGRNQIKFYDDLQYKNNIRKLDIEKRIRQSIINDCKGIEVFYQPIVDAKNNFRITGAEALLRYSDEVYGNVPPVVLIPILEETGLIIPVGRHVMKNAAKMCSQWRKKIPDFHVNVNLSYIQIRRSNIMTDITKIIDELNLPYEAVTLEITESGYLETDSRVMELFQQIQDKNIKLALDDFGTGYSNMRYLDDIKADTIKFDRGFTIQAVNNNYDFIVIKHMIDLIHSIGGKVCVEGIENDEELKKMIALKPDMIQGYLFGKPASASDFEKNLN